MPKLLPKDVWQRSGRWDIMGDELIRLKDRKGEDYCLSPTHEEIVTQIVANDVSSYRQLPLRIYQIGVKFRDEMRPRFGVIRGREFLMKDMYSFDVDAESAHKTYQEVVDSYHRIMNRVNLPYAVADADSGNIGGSKSHEFHALAEIGEDTLVYCNKCDYSTNVEKIFDEERLKEPITEDDLNPCDSVIHKCEHNGKLKIKKGIEIGHCFYLGTKYSEPMGASITLNNQTVPIEMGCFGIGVSRIMAALIETSHDKNGIIWPDSIAPYKAIIIPAPKMDVSVIQSIYDITQKIPYLNDDVVWDDRDNLGFGYKLKEASLIGFPYRIIVGKTMLTEGKVEVEKRLNGEKVFLTLEELPQYFNSMSN